MQSLTLSTAQPSELPFQEGKYAGQVNTLILKDSNSSAVFVRVLGKRISIENFRGVYANQLKKIFGEVIASDRNELNDLIPIFGSKTGKQNYGTCAPEDEEKILKRIELDASRPFQGNVFTGYAVTIRETGKIIGRISLGSGYEPGESQSGLIIQEEYRGKGYGKEAICLASALASVFYQRQYQVGDAVNKAPVNRFTATALDSNEVSIRLITKLGLEFIRPLTNEESYSDDPRSLYGVEGSRVDELLGRLIDKKLFSVVTLKTS